MTTAAPYSHDDHVTVYHGDCLDVLKTLPDNSIDAVCTDPPYGLGFMGHAWDQPGEYGSQRRNGKPGVYNRVANYDHRKTRARDGAMEAGLYDLSPSAMHNFQSWCEMWATECLRVLKPGGHMLAFGGSRTWHRLASAIEDAGFEIRDSIAWIYGSGFPKSLDVSKAIDKAAGAAREIVGKYQPPNGTTWNLANDEARSEVGAIGHSSRADSLNITAPATDAAKQWQGWGTALKPAFEPIVVARKPIRGTVAGNVIKHGTGALNIDACRIGDNGGARRGPDDLGVRGRPNDVLGAGLDLGNAAPRVPGLGRWPANVLLDDHQAAELDRQSGHSSDGTAVQRNGGGQRIFNHGDGLARADAGYNGAGGASRFFSTFRYTAKAATAERPTADGISHPTVKPLDLMRWLIRLITPPGGTVLDPFAGSGTTVQAAIAEGKRCIAIEREATYLPLITARTDRAQIGFDL